jgi:hypothetical protein
MGTFTGTTLIDLVSASILNDANNVRWSRATLLQYLNLAQVQVVSVQAQANSQYRTMQLAAGSRQSMQSDDMQLLAITRNMGADGQTPGDSIEMTDRAEMDAHLDSWTEPQDGVTEIESYVADDRVRAVYFVYPPVPANQDMWIEYISAVRPKDVAEEGDVISLPDFYVMQIMRWIIYMCLSLQMENPYSANNALHHYQLFNTELGQEMNAVDIVNPSIVEKYSAGVAQSAPQPMGRPRG